MSLNRYAARRDKNEPEIIAALEKVGAQVWQLKEPFDLLVGFRGKYYAIEVKDKNGKVTECQKEFAVEAGYVGCELKIVKTPTEALMTIGVQKK